MPGCIERSRTDAIETVSRIWIPAAQTILPANVVHGGSGSHINCYHHNGHCGFVCQKQKLSIQT